MSINNFIFEKNWKSSILYSDKLIKDAILSLNKSALKIVIVVDKLTKKFIATISDGDIRRALLNDKNLNSKITEIFNKKAFYIYEKNLSFYFDSNNNLYKLIGYDQIPILDKNKLVTNLLINKVEKNLPYIENCFLIMAGGRGQRLMPLTKDLPKPLLKIDNTTIIEKIIFNAKKYGFKNFLISVGYLKKSIKDFLKKGKKYDININYIEEEEPLGTAGSLKLLPKKFLKLPMIISNSDIICDINFNDLLNAHKKQNNLITIAAKSKNVTYPFGVLHIKKGKLAKIIEKPSTVFNINTGIYVLSPNIFNYLKKYKKKQRIDMDQLISYLISIKKKVGIFPVYEKWEDVSERFLKKK